MTVDPATLTDPRQVRNLRDNAQRLGRPDIVAQCVERLVELGAGVDSAVSPVELDCWKAVVAAEEAATLKNGRTTRLSRTRQKIARVGVIETMAELAGSETLHQGFELQRAADKLQFSFEYVVLKHPDVFPSDVRRTARLKLVQAGVVEDRLPPASP